MPKERYQCAVLPVGWTLNCSFWSGVLGYWIDGERVARRATKCNWSWCGRAKGAEVSMHGCGGREECTAYVSVLLALAGVCEIPPCTVIDVLIYSIETPGLRGQLP